MVLFLGGVLLGLLAPCAVVLGLGLWLVDFGADDFDQWRGEHDD